MFDILHDNCNFASVSFFLFFFSTPFSVLDILIKHSNSCLIYYMIIGGMRRFFNSPLGEGYPDETSLSCLTDIKIKHIACSC